MGNVCTVDASLELRFVVPLEGRVCGGAVVRFGFPLPSLGDLGKPTRSCHPSSRSITVSNARVGGVVDVCGLSIRALPVGRGKGADRRCRRASLVPSLQAQCTQCNHSRTLHAFSVRRSGPVVSGAGVSRSRASQSLSPPPTSALFHP